MWLPGVRLKSLVLLVQCIYRGYIGGLSGDHSSVVQHWWLKPGALGLIPWRLPTLQFPLYEWTYAVFCNTREAYEMHQNVLFLSGLSFDFLYRSGVCQDLPVYLPVFCNTREASEEAD